MFILLSPAKRLIEPIDFTPGLSVPRFVNESQRLWLALQELKIEQIESLMKVSPAIAELNFKRYQELSLNTLPSQKLAPCLLTFDGDAFRHLKAATFTSQQWERAEKQIGILSGLYGLLSPSDKIHPYRLEMKTRLKTDKAADLYQFWGEKINRAIEKSMKQNNQNTVLNLASNEYSHVVTRHALDYPIININFKQWHNGNLKTIAVNSKRARGAMARAIITECWTTPKDIQAFNQLGYLFSEEHSDESQYTYIAKP